MTMRAERSAAPPRPRPRPRHPIAATGAIVVLAFGASLTGCDDRPERQRARATCEALAEERFADAIALGAGPLDARGDDRETAECRCFASLSSGDREACTQLLDPLLSAPEAADWIPHPVLTKLMVRTWREAGRLEAAARLAERAAPEQRDDLDLLQLELMLRSQLEDEPDVLAALEQRLEADPSWIPQRLVLSLAWMRRSRHEAAVRVLGDTPPPKGHPLTLPWFESRILALAAANDLAGVQATFESWRATGWDPIDLAARYALRISVGQLVDPERDKISLLRDAIATQAELRDRKIVWGLHRRLIAELLAADRPEEALQAYDAAIEVVSIEDITREEIERAVRRASGSPKGTASPAEPIEAVSRLRFQLPSGTGGATLWISPGPDEPPDIGYQPLPVTGDGPIVVAAQSGDHPRRYVLEDREGRVRASGAVWPEAGAPVEVPIHLRPPPPARRWTQPIRAAGDGRRRVFAILADCADWRLTEYLRRRGELPFHDHLIEQGYRAVLESNPPFTAAALRALIWPAAGTSPDTLGWIHQLGLELAGLEAIGRNPLGWLSFVLPERANLFQILGSGPIVTANMLLAHGRIEAGRHAEIIGPHGEHRDLPSQDAYRSLQPDELERHPSLAQDMHTRRFAQTIAAEMDVADDLARQGEVDFLFLRLESLDLMTHGYFGALDGHGQDDAQGPLMASYRYIDERLADLYALLDEDDWLVYLSDHGIRSSMKHEEDAIFVALGEGVPRGRAPGQPSLRGVPHSLAAMLGVETDWPRSGTTPWLIARTNRGGGDGDGDDEIASDPTSRPVVSIGARESVAQPRSRE